MAVSDPAIRMILKIPLEATNSTDANIDAQIFHRGVSQGVGQVAIDWIAKNLYWVDGLYNWVAVRAINSTDESDMKVLFHDHIDEPQGLAVHPLKG